MEQSYDFIIIGAGASGAVLASRLARTPAAPSVLLIEAGGANANAALLSAAERFTVAFKPNSPLNWGYKTVPQTHLDSQEIDYSRGKGLGGSTAINFCGWSVGPRDDYDEWAEIAGDRRFCWDNVKKVLRRIENLDTGIPDQRLRDRLHAKSKDHSTAGNLVLTYGDRWMPDIGDLFTAAEQSGHKVNPDVNDGDPIGMGMGSVCTAKGIRATSASAYLSQPPQNLGILADTHVARLLFQDKRAVGVETTGHEKIFAKKEVIVSGGALNTPQILMLSGIGPGQELMKHNIPVLLDAPNVGANLQDHCFSATGIILSKDVSLPPRPPSQSPTPMGWFKLPRVMSSAEFQELPEKTKNHLSKPTVPAMEMAAYSVSSFLEDDTGPDETYMGAICLIMSPQSRGTVTLRSSNPLDPPVLDPKFLTHPFDRRLLIEGLREVNRVLSAPVYAARTVRRLGPKEDTDDAIWEHLKKNLHSSWHMSGTARMGKSQEEAVVDGRFKIFGLEACRVVDLSVCPFVINAHTQAAAYIVGEIAADTLAEEYGLGEVTISGLPVN